ncbi:MAG: copper chaperone PCu(A)C [Sulfitobacter sp.]|nr:copper chaperone PCu(A)C [Sulfitobacter sp.]
MKPTLFAAAAVLVMGAVPALAEIAVKDAYLRSSTPTSVTGTAFMILENTGETDDRLIAARSDVAGRVELHTHNEDDMGVMRMSEIKGGIPLPAGATHHLKRGGDHVMFMGLTAPLEQGSDVTVTLTFEEAGDLEVVIPVDHERRPSHDAMDHSTMNHDKTD